MRKSIYLGLLMLAGCAGTDPLGISEEHAARLQSRLEKRGEDRISLMFIRLDKAALKPGFFTAPVDAAFKAPAGERQLLLRIVRTQGLLTSPGSRILHETCIPVGASLKSGRTYVPAANVESGSVTVWVEDQASGEIVSDVVERQYYSVGPGQLHLLNCGGAITNPPRIGPPVVKRARHASQH